jgi:hypothetical protein
MDKNQLQESERAIVLTLSQKAIRHGRFHLQLVSASNQASLTFAGRRYSTGTGCTKGG